MPRTKTPKTPPQPAKPEGLALASIIAAVALDKKAQDIVAIGLDKLSTIADYFVICSASNSTQVRALADAVDDVLSKGHAIEPLRREGVQEGRWIAVDYSTVILHIFLQETRQFYQLERLWVNDNNVQHYEEGAWKR
jgi:ribosome-associated protein